MYGICVSSNQTCMSVWNNESMCDALIILGSSFGIIPIRLQNHFTLCNSILRYYYWCSYCASNILIFLKTNSTTALGVSVSATSGSPVLLTG